MSKKNQIQNNEELVTPVEVVNAVVEDTQPVIEDAVVVDEPVVPTLDEIKAIEAKLKAAREAYKAKMGEEPKVERRGRPMVPGCPRQLRLAAMEAKRAAGQEVKRGRPKMVKVETPAPVVDASFVAAPPVDLFVPVDEEVSVS